MAILLAVKLDSLTSVSLSDAMLLDSVQFNSILFYLKKQTDKPL